MAPHIQTLGELRQQTGGQPAAVKQEIRDNLMRKLQAGEPLFPGIIGYDDTVIPQLVNAILSRHNFILLGLRGQAKSRILRGAGRSARRADPGRARLRDPRRSAGARSAARAARASPPKATTLPIAWLPREARYVEKLATPDVTIADMIGDIDPIKAAQAGLNLADELTMHYGLLPRANRGIFAINELPDLAGKIQVGLFNILQEGDVQIKGYPVRLPLDVLLVFTANPEDYTARGKIITPLKDRIGSEIRTHYPTTPRERHGHHRAGSVDRSRRAACRSRFRDYVREVVEEVAFQARADRKIDKRSGVSQRLPITTLEIVVSNAERRALANGEKRRRAARHRRLRGAAVDHRQVRAGVRRRAARRRAGRARPHPGGRRQRLRRHVRRRRHAHGRRVVRPRRLAAAERRDVGRRRARADQAACRGCASSPSAPALRAGRAGAGRRLGHRLRARGPVRAEEDQPQRRARLHGRRPKPRAKRAPARREEPRHGRRDPDARAARRSTTTEQHPESRD